MAEAKKKFEPEAKKMCERMVVALAWKKRNDYLVPLCPDVLGIQQNPAQGITSLEGTKITRA